MTMEKVFNDKGLEEYIEILRGYREKLQASGEKYICILCGFTNDRGRCSCWNDD
jgi:hypothetical protein